MFIGYYAIGLYAIYRCIVWLGRRKRSLRSTYREVWNDSAKKDLINAICDGYTKEQFEESGKSTVDNILLTVMPKNAIILDVGCGIGRIDSYLASYCKQLHCVDISDEMITIARDRLKKFQNVFVYRADARELEFSDNTFDFIFSFLVVQHMNKEDSFVALTEIFRVLKKGGKALIQFPNLLSEVYFKSFLADVRSRERKINRVRAYTTAEIEKNLSYIGFKVVEINKHQGDYKNSDTELYYLLEK
ncbi:MAG: class I SAM-dependent methyltransferase [Candidatus Altiarchaeota archaeon]